jgi:hypothetical protein
LSGAVKYFCPPLRPAHLYSRRHPIVEAAFLREGTKKGKKSVAFRGGADGAERPGGRYIGR